jgi:hypothetical protein
MSHTSPKRYHVLPSIASGLIALAALAVGSNDVRCQGPGLARVGPIDPSIQYPLFYEDTNGLRLALCRNPGACGFLLPDPNSPARYPTSPTDTNINWPDESFYWGADASMQGNNGARALLIIALEGAFAGGSVVFQDNIVFARVRIRIDGLVDGASYTVTHPYGSRVYVAGVDGPNPGSINVTDDVGIGAPMQFNLALHGAIGPFLTPLGFIHPGVPGQLIADGATEVQVTGSPLNTNFFRIQGPNANTIFPANAAGNNRAQINTFVIMGQVASQLGATVDKVTVNKTPTETAVNVWASTAPGQSLVVDMPGSPSLPMQGGGADGKYFARAVFPGGGGSLPNSVTVTNTTDFPNTSFPGPALTDTVEITSAVFTVGGDLVVSAHSTDKVGNPTLTASGENVPPTALNNLGNGEASGTIPMLPGTVPPKVITVESSTGGTAESHVVVEGNGAVGGATPLVANAGPDQTVASGALVHLSGINSTGTITTFAWTDDSPQVNLVGANTATPQFTAPIVGTNLHVDVTLTLLIRDGVGNASVDTMIVHVNGPSGPLDVVTITEARYTANKNQWRIGGSNTLHQGQQVHIYIGAIGNRSRLIATVPVPANGRWLFQSPDSNGIAALPADTTVWAESTLPGTPGQLPFRRL